MTSQAERKRRKRAQRQRESQAAHLGLAPLAASPKRQKSGNRSQAGDERGGEDPRKVALKARARHAGKTVTRTERERAAAPHAGSPVGLCLWALHPEREARKLWSVWMRYTAAMERYERRILGTSSHAKGMNLEPEREPDEDHTAKDDRTEDEKDAYAIDARDHWHALERRTGTADALHVARTQDQTLWREGAPTRRGAAVVAALDRLSGAASRARGR